MWRWALPVSVTGSPRKLFVLAASSAPQRTLPLQPGWPHEPSAQQRRPWPHCSQQWCMLPWGRSGGRLRPSLIAWRYHGGVCYAFIPIPIRLYSILLVYLFFHPHLFLLFAPIYFFQIFLPLFLHVVRTFSFNVLYTDDDSCIAIETSVDQTFFLTGETNFLLIF